MDPNDPCTRRDLLKGAAGLTAALAVPAAAGTALGMTQAPTGPYDHHVYTKAFPVSGFAGPNRGGDGQGFAGKSDVFAGGPSELPIPTAADFARFFSYWQVDELRDVRFLQGRTTYTAIGLWQHLVPGTKGHHDFRAVIEAPGMHKAVPVVSPRLFLDADAVLDVPAVPCVLPSASLPTNVVIKTTRQVCKSTTLATLPANCYLRNARLPRDRFGTAIVAVLEDLARAAQAGPGRVVGLPRLVVAYHHPHVEFFFTVLVLPFAPPPEA